jgi:hypothetical protein
MAVFDLISTRKNADHGWPEGSLTHWGCLGSLASRSLGLSYDVASCRISDPMSIKRKTAQRRLLQNERMPSLHPLLLQHR